MTVTATNPVATLLREARATIATPDRWAQGSFAYDSDGNPVSPNSQKAACFCSLGALYRAAGCDTSSSLPTSDNTFIKKAEMCLDKAASRFGDLGIVDFNDIAERTHDEVLRAFDSAIKIATETETA
jgi:hypothetical protein